MRARRKQKLSQDAAAKIFGVDRKTIYNWENGKTIPASKIEAVDNFINDALGLESNAAEFHPTRRAGVPLISQYAYAGYLGGYGDPTYVDMLPTIDFTPDREMTGNWLAFEVKGDSMDDGSKQSYVEGEIVICREVEREYWRDSRLFINKRDFVIVHQDGILIKRIVEHNVALHRITIHSLNPMYHDRVLDLREVKQIFSIVESRLQRRR